ncbi:MAG: hypothetical protein COB06_002275 [Pseudomonas sp.]|jgi:chromosome segregation ATPase|uniref:Uncharacterized protein n=1 Tax=Halopseudomonas formosensis TaxID=1002526 RepID=A0ABU5BUR8_9GAMM|nr:MULTISPECIES: hypothetical protein [Pseudomonadaceae]MEB3734567.1 hypothetical protein [Halopseudomonas pachastrellae]MED5494055.1 hypothetical protein [Pseudomonadota bacterium]MBL1306059.1 hypothetical protein [Pseudomonas sp.]MDX9686481.1 hypothetical protein [Halopseudomonas formosensis]UGV30794.1 hypothetical protein LO767_17870 [Halopseudomonas aestusnigri]|tara:strand:- start:211 stop:369 length:159 start_codon:yes stop_codon:yes gene_type:complete
MRLKFVKLSHFRGYRTTTVIPIDEAMTGSVGRNDDGQTIGHGRSGSAERMSI